jgi:hypothetical protein
MVKEQKTLFQVSCEHDYGLTAKECEALLRDKDFQVVLRTARLKFWKELAADPHRSKMTAVGQLLALADLLTAQGAYDKASNVIMNVARMEGWLDEKNQINVFADLNAKDFANMRAKLAPKVEALSN